MELDFVFSADIPVLYKVVNRKNLTIREYSFIRGNTKYQQGINTGEIPEIDLPLSDLREHKKELEEQLKLNFEHCLRYYSLCALNIKIWLSKEIPDIPLSGDSKSEFAIKLALPLQQVFTGITVGASYNDIRLRLEKDELLNRQIKVDLNSASIHYDFNILLNSLRSDIEQIQNIVAPAVDLYFNYLTVVSNINNRIPKDYTKLLRKSVSSMTEKEQVDRIEEIYREVGKYPEAIKRFNNEMGKEVYNGYNSFKAARYRVRNS